MIPLGLSAADTRSLRTTLIESRRVQVRVALLSPEGDHLHDLTPLLTGGQVDMDATVTPNRTATITLADPHRSLAIDSDSPATSAIWADRMIRIVYDVLVGDEWVPIPVFTGPINLPGCSRDGFQATVEGHGKETLAMGSCWAPMTLHKGMKKTDAIRRVLVERAGETQFDIPDLPVQLPKPISLHRDAEPWSYAQHIARSMAMQLFYDGRGTCRLRRRPGTVGFTFTGDAHVVGAPQVTFAGVAANAVYVFGGVPKGSKTHVTASAVAPRNHPLSPFRLGRNGVPRYLLPNGQITQDDLVKTRAEAQARADHDLEDALRQGGAGVTFDSVPVPFLDPQDLCLVHTSDLSMTFRLGAFSLPLVAGEGSDGVPMTVGYTRRLTPHKRPKARRR